MAERTEARKDPHQGLPILSTGERLDRARAAMIMVHGRGASAEDILSFTNEFDNDSFVYLAPQARGGTWYPGRFLDPLEANEPWLSSALASVGRALDQARASGTPPERTILLGFSQGACLALEFAARNARRFGGVVGWSGGLIGPDGTERDYQGSFEGTPVFLGCSDMDPHIPKQRVLETEEVMERMEAEVTTRLYPRMAHTVNNDEIQFLSGLMTEVAA
jgi:phospholipase/carboxylesterase